MSTENPPEAGPAGASTVSDAPGQALGGGATLQASSQLENIKVAVRLRPFTEKEKQRNCKRIVDIEQNTVALYSHKHGDTSQKRFTFDYSYWSHDGFLRDKDTGFNVPDLSHPNCSKYVGQEKVFEDLGVFLLNNALQGYNSALLAYGQTGSGKSYTVSGYGQNEGILPRFARALFAELDKKTKMGSEMEDEDNNNNEAPRHSPSPEVQDSATTGSGEPPDELSKVSEEAEEGGDGGANSNKSRYEVFFSMIEIYNEVVRDLLAKDHRYMMSQSNLARRGLKVREHPKRGFFVENLTSYSCTDKDDIERRIEEGQLNKSIAATSMNETSSRGHTIYEFRIKQYKPKSDESPMETLTTSVVQLVDLAGSERLAVHVNGELGGDSFIGSRSNSPYPTQRHQQQLEDIQQKTINVAKKNNRAKSSASSASSSTAQLQQQPQASSHTSTRRHNTQQHNKNRYQDHQQRFKESVSINQSLSALGNCIQVLSQYSQQLDSSISSPSSSSSKRQQPPKIPYRDSVLTKLLNRCCLSGNSKVVIIATLSPADTNYDDTLSTLRFADRAKQIRTHATVNRLSRGEIMGNLQKENERLKQMIDGRVTRSDDSSQTSNFDDTENMIDNFNGPKATDSKINAIATPSRGRTTIKKTNSNNNNKDGSQERRNEKYQRGTVAPKLSSSNSNPSLAMVEDKMNRIVSPANRKMAETGNGTEGDRKNRTSSKATTIHKSRSVGHGLANKQSGADEADGDIEVDDDSNFDEIDLTAGLLEGVDLNELADVDEGLMSPDSDDSFAALTEEGLTNDEKIRILNRLLSNSNMASRMRRRKDDGQATTRSLNKIPRPQKRGPHGKSAGEDGISKISAISSSLKKTNPYLSNLNQDEQLTGMISYIIKYGETVIGKSNDCDIQLFGPELRGKHAKISRIELPATSDDGDEKLHLSEVYIEPILGKHNSNMSTETEDKTNIALMVNGVIVTDKTKLHHCDRLLFGSNGYFVFIDKTQPTNQSGDTIADLDLVTYDTAHNEVLRKIMSEAKNEAMIKEINDYTHRPGTGKYRAVKTDESNSKSGSPVKKHPSVQSAKGAQITRGVTTSEPANAQLESSSSGASPPKHSPDHEQGTTGREKRESFIEDTRDDYQQDDYREKLMQSTYEYAMPVAEVNAIAKEMGIKATYGLKILTGEEQLPEQINSTYFDANNSDSFSSSSLGDVTTESETATTTSKTRSVETITTTDNGDNVTQQIKVDTLDIPPALYIHLHLEELKMDFYWSKDKFQDRRFKILELYGSWDVGGKSGLVEYLIDQSKYLGDYLFDPFIDDPLTTFVLIGHAQVSLQPLSYMSDLNESYDILDVNDEIVGSIRIQATPCHIKRPNQTTTSRSASVENQNSIDNKYVPLSEVELAKNLVENPEDILGKRIAFKFQIISCHNIPQKYTRIYCQYTFNRDNMMVRTKILREDNNNNEGQNDSGGIRHEQEVQEVYEEELRFNHNHFVSIDKVERDILDFLQHGFLTVQVLGQYRLNEKSGSSPTVISTIINSINKYKFKMEQQSSYNGMNYSNSIYANSVTDSARSNRVASSGILNSNSGASSVASTSATVNLFDQQNDDDEGINSINGLSQENIIDMILTKRKLDRAENQLHYLKRTINIAEHYNKKHIPVKTVKKLLNSYGHELESGSLEEMAADVIVKGRNTNNKHSNCTIQ